MDKKVLPILRSKVLLTFYLLMWSARKLSKQFVDRGHARQNEGIPERNFRKKNQKKSANGKMT